MSEMNTEERGTASLPEVFFFSSPGLLSAFATEERKREIKIWGGGGRANRDR